MPYQLIQATKKKLGDGEKKPFWKEQVQNFQQNKLKMV